MADEVSPTGIRPPSFADPVGNSPSRQNAPVAALNVHCSATGSGLAAELPWSPTCTFNQLGSTIESGSLPDHNQSDQTAAANESSAGHDSDPGYTDNDNLCNTCRFLLEPRPACEGWEVKHCEEGPHGRGPNWSLTAKMTWTENLRTTLLDEDCPLCSELYQSMEKSDRKFLQSQSTHYRVTVVKLCQYSPQSKRFLVSLSVSPELQAPPKNGVLLPCREPILVFAGLLSTSGM